MEPLPPPLVSKPTARLFDRWVSTQLASPTKTRFLGVSLEIDASLVSALSVVAAFERGIHVSSKDQHQVLDRSHLPDPTSKKSWKLLAGRCFSL